MLRVAAPARSKPIRQVAALPYRIDEAGQVRVLLVTTRETKRWVVPKGNRMRGLAPHEAAAREAYEEAGITGIACPAALGSFEYLKRRGDGRHRRATVAVYPVRVVDQLDSFPERAERETRWFDLAGAARAVEEPGLKALIGGFRQRPRDAGRIARASAWAREAGGRKFRMLRWFQALMPKQGHFFEQFEAHAATLVAGADALARTLQGGGGMTEEIREIHDREHDADAITREVLQDVRRILITPFDRTAISSLIAVMDDAIDQMNKAAKSITLFEVTDFAPQMRDIGGIIVEAARLTAEAMPLLRSIGDNQTRILELTERMVTIEGVADDLHDSGLKTLFKSAEQPDAMPFIVGRELYSNLERVVDRFEDVANEIQGLVIDHA